MNMQAHKSNNPLLNAIGLVLVALSLFLMVSCKKSITEPTVKIDTQSFWFRISNIDKDGQSSSTPIFKGKMEALAVEHIWEPEPNWKEWAEWLKKKWCEDAKNNKYWFYCKICSAYPSCISTPVLWTEWGVKDNTIYWTVEYESNVDHYKIEYAADGKTFKLLDIVNPKGASKYIYTINKH